MQIPESCQAWVVSLEGGSEPARRTLHNLQADPCIAENVATDFFRHLVAALSAPLTSADDALDLAHKIVAGAPDTFTCTGREVPDNRMTVLARIESVGSLRYRVPRLLDGKGLTDRLLTSDGLSEEELRSLTSEYDGPVTLGNGLGVVWVTDGDLARIREVQRLAELANGLGMGMEGVHRAILCVYNRMDTARTLHVPRALDAIGQRGFVPNPDCSASVGRTRPVTGPAEAGLAEAVHRSCTVRPTRWELMPL